MRILTLITALLAVSLPVRALEVLTTIKPLGFIAAAITDGVSEPGVLLPTVTVVKPEATDPAAFVMRTQ